MKKKHIILLIFLLVVAFLIISTIFYNDSTKLSGGYIYYPENRHILGKIDIPPNVISYDYDENFIIVKQKPTEVQDAIYDKMEYEYEQGRSDIYYWLIIHDKDLVLGPMDSITYLKSIEDYKVSENLKLK